mgnify:FL=1|jgi:DNA invertase Pin-like site-specific DNA recombinase|tara:strand:+ start:468 stop:794 length:327 start_codon:yes stop_codon:yes gene_type:complete
MINKRATGPYDSMRKVGGFETRDQLKEAILAISAKRANTTLLEISKKVGVSVSTVRRIKEEEKITKNPKRQEAYKRDSVTELVKAYWPAPDPEPTREYLKSLGIHYVP